MIMYGGYIVIVSSYFTWIDWILGTSNSSFQDLHCPGNYINDKEVHHDPSFFSRNKVDMVIDTKAMRTHLEGLRTLFPDSLIF